MDWFTDEVVPLLISIIGGIIVSIMLGFFNTPVQSRLRLHPRIMGVFLALASGFILTRLGILNYELMEYRSGILFFSGVACIGTGLWLFISFKPN